MARQRYTQEQVTTALEQSKGMVTVAARLLGCVPNTVQAYIDRYPQVAEARNQQREAMTDVAELALYKAIQSGEAWAVCFYLKTQGKGRGYVERQEHTGADGGPIREERITRIVIEEAPPRRLAGANGHTPDTGALDVEVREVTDDDHA